MASVLTCQARQLLPVQNTRCVLENTACTHTLCQCELAAVVLDTLRHATSLTAHRLQSTHQRPQGIFIIRACFDSHDVNKCNSIRVLYSCYVAVRFSSVGKTLTQTRLDKAKRRTTHIDRQVSAIRDHAPQTKQHTIASSQSPSRSKVNISHEIFSIQ